MPKVKINDVEYDVTACRTIMQACDELGIEIPRFCYHEKLKIAGNCRMCLVEVKNMPKLVASCSMTVCDNMEIYTNSEKVKKARNSVLEMMLINHPLDCPICDQAGECDLQDLTMFYGKDRSRYQEEKRAVKDKYMGPLVKTHMTRCIHCTRCVRFLQDVAGVPELGGIGRGEDTEITTYVEKSLTSELAGNIVDLCPVGALTSKPYAFRARPWELKRVETIDVMDAIGSHIVACKRGNEILRILPAQCEDINEDWISDKTRHAFDGIYNKRIDRPFIRKKGLMTPVEWNEALELIASKIKSTDADNIAFVAGKMADAETLYSFKKLASEIGVKNIDCRENNLEFDINNRASYLFNSGINGIDEADALLIIGANPRLESPVLNARIRARFANDDYPVAVIGDNCDLTYKYNYLGDEIKVINELIKGKNDFAKILKNSHKPMLIVGDKVISGSEGKEFLALIYELVEALAFVKDGWNGFNLIHSAASLVAGLDLGFVPHQGGYGINALEDKAKSGELKLLYLIEADEIQAHSLHQDCFIIYQGYVGDSGASNADVVIPSTAYLEKNSTYLNLEGRLQRTKQAAFSVGLSRDGWMIANAISSAIEKPIELFDLETVRAEMAQTYPIFAGEEGKATKAEWTPSKIKSDKLKAKKLPEYEINFFTDSAIARASKTMYEVRRARAENKNNGEQ